MIISYNRIIKLYNSVLLFDALSSSVGHVRHARRRGWRGGRRRDARDGAAVDATDGAHGGSQAQSGASRLHGAAAKPKRI